MVFKKKKNESDQFSKLRNWGGVFDIPSYAHAVNECLPYLSDDEVVFLWKRAVNEKNSDDDERQWFGEITIGNIVSYLPDSVRKQYISNLDLRYFRNKKVQAILLLQLSKLSTGETRADLQKEAWTCSAYHCNDPIKNPSDSHAAALEWSDTKDDGEKMVWIDTVIDMYDSLVIQEIWESYIAKAKFGEVERKDEFVSQVSHLAKKLPNEAITQACFDCFDVFKSAGRIEEVGHTISILIEKLPSEIKKTFWKSIIEYGFDQQPSFVPWYDPKKLAKYLEKIMPNNLWLQTML